MADFKSEIIPKNDDPYKDMKYGFIHDNDNFVFKYPSGEMPTKDGLADIARLLAKVTKGMFDTLLEDGMPHEFVSSLTGLMVPDIKEVLQKASQGFVPPPSTNIIIDIIIRDNNTMGFALKLIDDDITVSVNEGMAMATFACYEAIIALFSMMGDSPETFIVMPEIVQTFNSFPR